MPSSKLNPTSEAENVIGIQFGIFSPEQVEKRAVIEITTHSTYNGVNPTIGGLFDPRLGVIDNGKKTCKTCLQNNAGCPGHWGKLTLARPVIYVQFINYVVSTLRCVCIKCAKLLINKEKNAHILRKKGAARLKAITEMCKKIKRCGQDTEDGCGAKQPTSYKRLRLAEIWAEWDDLMAATIEETEETGALTTVGTEEDGTKKLKKMLEVDYILRLFKRISNEDVDFIGLSRHWSRPDWMICTVLPIAPPQVRPSVVTNGGPRSEDDLTHKYVDIIKTNASLAKTMEEHPGVKNKIDDWTQVLQYHVATLVNNQIPGVPKSAQRNGRPLKSLKERLGSKEGRFRSNLQGKRVDFSARSVITPDPNISVGELGVPVRVAQTLTYPEVVTRYNIDMLYKLVQAGPDVWPGAKSIMRVGDQRLVSLAHVNRAEVELKLGDTVYRHMLDKDPVLFNRQPSLHKMSMMCHKAKILPGFTFRLNVSSCSPYNADFDGDEMNLHLAQSIEARTELEELVALPKQIISVRENKPVILPVQDAAVGAYRLTRPDVRFAPHEMMNFMMYNRQFTGVLPKTVDGEFTGAQVVSQLLAPINIEMRNKMYDDATDNPKNVKREAFESDEAYAAAVEAAEERGRRNVIRIRQGVIEQGMLDKDSFGKGSRGIIHLTYNYFGRDAAVNLLDALQSVVSLYLVMRGFSVGVSDLIADEETRTKMTTAIKSRKSELETLVQKLHSDMIETSAGVTRAEEFERKVFGILNKATDDAGDIGLKSLSDANRMINMIRAGSKGSKTNVSQMVAVVGQQNVEGKRIPYGFTDRTLPHFKRYDDGARARGFVENSFISGLSPEEFFFHAMSGREGLIDTAVKSLEYRTEILLQDDAGIQKIQIGKWIDDALAKNKSKVKYETAGNMELLDTKGVFIPTVDEAGNMTWGEITAITRHDPGDKLYEIETYSGRKVTVTASKSLIVWKDGKFQPMLTPDVKVGDYLPTTAYLPPPPIIQTVVQLEKYLPKTEYIYGTDMIMAIEFANDKTNTEDDWIDQELFEVPHKTLKALRQVINRRDTSVYKAGLIHSYGGPHSKGTPFPDTFELNEENGVFLGLFLAEGNVDIPSGYVQISNNDETIRTFIKHWFDKHGISWKFRSRHMNGGLSEDIRGFSKLLGRFLDAFVGHGSEHKYVPDEAFAAPEEFIIGLINGYFSGDGCVANGGITSSSVSNRLTMGISTLCARLGIFTKIRTYYPESYKTRDVLPRHDITIRGQWATLFTEKIKLIYPWKQERLMAMAFAKTYESFDEVNDIALDAIVKITEVSPDKHPKMYDVTVPSTLNFMIANGLNVRDTADTGYVQRQLVKAMEDLVVHHDFSVRDAGGNIIQYVYGDDRIEGSRVESQELKILQTKGPVPGEPADAAAADSLRFMHYADVLDKYGWRNDEKWEDFLAPQVAKEIRSGGKETLKELNRWCDEVRDNQRTMLFNAWGRVAQEAVYYPVNLNYLITQIASNFKVDRSAKTDLSPVYVARTVRNLLDTIGNGVFSALMHYWCSPRRIVKDLRYTRKAWDYLIENIRVRHVNSMVPPGEMVGVIAAQSIGEPSTQIADLFLLHI